MHDGALELILASAVSGRERWDAPFMRRHPVLAQGVQALLQSKPGVNSVVANPMTGRILIQYDPAVITDVQALLIAAFEKALGLEGMQGSGGQRHQSRNALVRVLEVTTPQRDLVVKAVVASAAVVVLGFISAYVTSWFLGGVVGASKSGEAGAEAVAAGEGGRRWSKFWFTGAVSTAVNEISIVAKHVERRLWRKIAASVERDLRAKAFAHLTELDMGYFDGHNTGSLMALLSQDTATIGRFVENGPGNAIEVAVSVTVGVLILFTISPPLVSLVALPVAGVFLTYRYFQRRIVPFYARNGTESGALNALLSSNISGIATVKSFTSEAIESKRVREAGARVKESHEAAGEISSLYTSGQGLLYGGVGGLVLTLAAVWVERGKLTSRSFLMVAQMVPRLMSAMNGLNDIYDLYMSASGSAERLLHLLDTKPAIVGGTEVLEPADVRGHIVYKDIRFTYPNGFDVLKGLDLEIPPGEIIGVVGATGAGKTTLIKLLLRFYDPHSGSVLIDGVDTKTLSLESLRSSIGFVGQDVYLFDGSVLDNILYGRPSASREEVIAAAKAAEAHDFITRLPQGYETLVGERGQRLSTGQRQRISIARAVIKNAPMLVLDEATAAVDNETEASIHRSIERIGAGRSVVIVAHRLSTVRNANRIYVLNDGVVVERGTHDELLEKKGLYASFWNVQTGKKTARAKA